ncbi:MAG: LOG family protein [Candidatus Glassbacteria bacterium]|nr:LOG family protein [Candidatus Glassbacteria bacterium]
MNGLPDFARIRETVGPPGARWVCVFGTSDPAEKQSTEQARTLGRLLAERGWVVVTGGYTAVMEGANRGAREAGGFSVGVGCRLFSREPNCYLDELIWTGNLLMRLETLLHLGDGYVACKGGTGTLAEIAVAWEYINKKILPPRPLVLLGEFWSRLPEILSDQAAAPGVSPGRAGKTIATAETCERAVELLADGFERLEREN